MSQKGDYVSHYPPILTSLRLSAKRVILGTFFCFINITISDPTKDAKVHLRHLQCQACGCFFPNINDLRIHHGGGCNEIVLAVVTYNGVRGGGHC